MQTAIKSKHAKDNPKRDDILHRQEPAEKNTSETQSEDMATAGISHEERHELIATAAYFRAAQRSFVPGYELEDWLGAEAEISQGLSQTKSGNRRDLI
jgi:hypothetical protein